MSRAPRRAILAAAALLVAILVAGGQPAGGQTPAPTLPEGFEVVTLVSGLTGPIAVDWAPDGRMFIAEKGGKVLVVLPGETTARTVIDLTAHVNSRGDRGLTGMAVDRDFATNGYLWLLYNYEDGSNPAGAKTARLTRIAIAPDGTVANPSAPETVVLGTVSTPPCPAASNTVDCIPAPSLGHTVGTVRSDPTDGTLWVGNGDTVNAGTFNVSTYDEQSLVGKLIHVDRNGRGLPGHPFCPTDTDLTHVCTKLHAKGLRSPFRFTLRPGKPPVLGDVGWNTREEIDLVEKGKNYGWPCYEGGIRTPAFSVDSRCATLYAAEGTPDGAAPPLWDCGRDTCSTIIAGPTYTATAYPPEYRGDVFIGDYAQGWVRRLELDGADGLLNVAGFADELFGFVDLELAPNGNLTFVDIGDFSTGTGAIRQFRYTPFNRSPVAQAGADRTFGSVPLEVRFRGSGSTDPDGDTITYDWDFGDGSPHSSEPDPVHTYTDGSANATATLTVSDGNGGSDTSTVEISPGNAPPGIDSLTAPATYQNGRALTVNGTASDPQDGPLSGAALTWSIALHHNDHFHEVGATQGGTATFTPQTDHDADSSYDVTLTAKDSRGLTASRTVTILPETVNLTLASSPAGAQLTYGSTRQAAPFTRQTAIGFRTPVSAAAHFIKDGTVYDFESWSDGGAQVHEVTVPATDSTLTAAYRPAPPGAYRTQVLESPGLVSYWQLGEPFGTTAFDELERHPGSYLNGVALGRPGALPGDPDTAAGFDGVNDELTAGGSGLALATGTLEGWFYWESGVALMRDSSGADASSWILAYNSGGKLAYRVGGKTFVTARTFASVQNGWHHFALTVGGGSAALYIDGQRVHTGTGVAAIKAVMPWRIMRNGGYVQHSRGRADEVAIYDTPLSAATIAAHYAAKDPPDTTPPAAPRALAATAGNGSVALDWSDNGEPDLAGYDVYRSTTAGGPYTKLNTALVTGSAHTDSSAQNGTTYYYVVKAVDTGGRASDASNEASATPSAPPASTYSSVVRGTAGLRAYWRLGEPLGTVARDETGAFPGAYAGGPALGQPGALAGDSNTAVGFDGANDEMTAGGAGLALTAGTLEGWFYWQSGAALMRDTTSTTTTGWILAYNSGGKLAYRVAGKSFVTARTFASVQNGWHYLALAAGGGSATLYVDGQSVHNSTGIPATAAKMPWRVMRNGAYAQYARGRADEVAVYNTALTPATISAHYAAGR